MNTTTTSSSPEMTADGDQIVMLVTFKVKSEMRSTFKQALLDDVSNARQESGCISMVLFEAKDDPGILFLFERWQNQSALDNHFAQPYTKAVLGLAEMALTSPMQILYVEDLVPLPVKDLQSSNVNPEGVDLIVLFEVKEGMDERFKEQFLNSVRHSRPELGCEAFHIHAVRGDDSKFVLYERWRNQEAFNFHLAQPYTQELFDSFGSTLVKPVEDGLIYIRELTLSMT
jgi:quinol monooxygenase YgiN